MLPLQHLTALLGRHQGLLPVTFRATHLALAGKCGCEDAMHLEEAPAKRGTALEPYPHSLGRWCDLEAGPTRRSSFLDVVAVLSGQRVKR